MLMIFKYLKARYLSEKAQGIVEYALVIAFVVAIGAVLVKTGNGSLTDGIQKIFDDLAKVVTTGSGNADTATSSLKTTP